MVMSYPLYRWENKLLGPSGPRQGHAAGWDLDPGMWFQSLGS